MKKLLFIDSYSPNEDYIKCSSFTAYGKTHIERLYQILSQNLSLNGYDVVDDIKSGIDVSLFNHLYGVIWPLKYYPLDSKEIVHISQKILYSLYNIFLCSSGSENSDPFKIDEGILFLGTLNPINNHTPIILKSDSIVQIKSEIHYLSLQSSSPLCRNFNNLRLDYDYYIKSSSKLSKIKAEFDFIDKVNEKQKKFFPRIGTNSLIITASNASYKIEKIEGLDCATLLLNNEIDTDFGLKFKNFISAWLHTVSEFHVCLKPHSNRFVQFLVSKTLERYRQFQKSKHYDFILHLSQNSNNIVSPDEFLKILLKKFDLHKEELDLAPIGPYHGDLCLSNILYRSQDDSFFLIDPRGYQKEEGICLSIFYEMAKLRHSIVSGYDFINTNNSFIFMSECDLLVRFNKISSLLLMREIFEGLRCQFNIKEELIVLIESSLFFSMLPLHDESLSKIVSFYITANKLMRSIA